MSESVIEVPIRGSDEYISVSLAELPEDATDIVDILKAEMAPLDLWINLAVAYYKQGKIEAFKTVLLEASEPDVERIFAQSKKERIAILNTLASYYTNLATKQKEKTKREDLFNQATANYNRADKIDIREELTWIGKGVLLLCRGENSRAFDYFENVLKANPNNMPAYLGKACILYNNGKYEEALNCYKAVLNNSSNAPASVRHGLGLCYYKLGKPNAAKKAFERVLQLDQHHVEAMTALAILEMNQASTGNTINQGALKRSLALLKRAHEINPNHPMVLNHLANHFFFRKDYKKAQDLANSALHNTEVDKIKAESYYQIARAYHAQSDYDNAFQYYLQAAHSWPEYPLAQYGLGQMHIRRAENEKAIKCFEVVLKAQPENYEALKILGSLTKSTNQVKAFGYLKKVTELHPYDVEAWIELAQLTENNFTEALDAYEKARQIQEETKQAIPAELYNNIGVLKQVLGDVKGAEEAYTKAIETSGVSVEEFKAVNITTTYNLARLHEQKNEFDRAETLYKGILKEHPNYIDCYLRLSCMAKAKGEIYAASDWIKDSFAVNEKHLDSWTLMGNLHLSKEEWGPAQKKFERIIEIDKHDSYSLLALGNLYYAAKNDKKDREEKYLRHAMEFFWKVLQLDPSDIYAANGMGIIFAEQGKLHQAKDFFVEVREVTANMPDVWVNLAHVYLAQGLHVNAIKMYQNCLKKFYYNKDPTVLLFLARAYFEAGRMDDCRDTLVRIIHISPDRKDIWFNLALCYEQNSAELLKRDKRVFADVKKALSDLNQALSIFNNLNQAPGTGTRAAYIQSKADKHAKYCQTLVGVGQKQLAKAEEIERTQQQQRERIRLETEAYMLRKAAEEEEKVRKELERKQQEDAAAREFQQKADALLQMEIEAQALRDDDDKSKKRKRKNKQKDNFIASDEEPEYASSASDKEDNNNNNDDNEENSGKKKKKKKSRKSRKDEGEDGENEEDDLFGEDDNVKKFKESRGARAKALQALADRNKEGKDDDKKKKRRKGETEEERAERKRRHKKEKKEKKQKKEKKEKKHRKKRNNEEEEEEEEEGEDQQPAADDNQGNKADDSETVTATTADNGEEEEELSLKKKKKKNVEPVEPVEEKEEGKEKTTVDVGASELDAELDLE